MCLCTRVGLILYFVTLILMVFVGLRVFCCFDWLRGWLLLDLFVVCCFVCGLCLVCLILVALLLVVWVVLVGLCLCCCRADRLIARLMVGGLFVCWVLIVLFVSLFSACGCWIFIVGIIGDCWLMLFAVWVGLFVGISCLFAGCY